MIIKGFDVHELEQSEIPEMLKLRNAIFGHISRDHWDAMNCTAVVATKDGELMGAIPLQFRDYKINGEISIPVVFENAVGVSEKARGTGIGTIMLDHAKDFIKDRVDALFVYRGGERTPAYRFYRKTHHGDVYFQRLLRLNNAKCGDNDVTVHEYEKAIEMEPELLRLFHSYYAGYGGHRKREKGYFKEMVASHVYRESEWKLFVTRKNKKITGYAVIKPKHVLWEGWNIYDLAVSDNTALKKLLDKIALSAKSRNESVVMPFNPEHKLFKSLIDYGFKEEPDSPYIMVYVLRPHNIFNKLAKGSPLLSSLELKAVTPHRDLILNQPKRPKHRATLYLKETQLSRLLCCRLDFMHCLETNLIRMTWVPKSVQRSLHKIFKFCRWNVAMIDYV
jgi:GNAT superfamily N-acetyltransferase